MKKSTGKKNPQPEKSIGDKNSHNAINNSELNYTNEKVTTSERNSKSVDSSSFNRSDKIAFAALMFSIFSFFYGAWKNSQQDEESKRLEFKRDSLNQVALIIQTKPNRPYLTVKSATVHGSGLVRAFTDTGRDSIYIVTVDPAFMVVNSGGSIAEGIKLKYAVIITDALDIGRNRIEGPFDNSCSSSVLDIKDTCKCRSLIQTGVRIIPHDYTNMPRFKYYLVYTFLYSDMYKDIENQYSNIRELKIEGVVKTGNIVKVIPTIVNYKLDESIRSDLSKAGFDFQKIKAQQSTELSEHGNVTL